MTAPKKKRSSINDRVPLSFDIIPDGWTREAWNGCLLLGHPEGGFATLDFESGAFVLGLEEPKDNPKRSVKVPQEKGDWQARMVEKAMVAMQAAAS